MWTIAPVLSLAVVLAQGVPPASPTPPTPAVPPAVSIAPVTLPALDLSGLAGLADALAAAGEGISAAGIGAQAAREGLVALGLVWDQGSQDPADSLYRAARTALNRGDNRRAADTFREVGRRYPRSTRAGDALYWEAYALYRLGGTDDLRAARDRLRDQERAYANAATVADARTLMTRINGELARRGDEEAAAAITGAARREEGRQQSGQNCPDEDDDPRMAALNALLQMNADDAIPILKKVMARRDPCSVQLRRKAMFLISQKHSPEAQEILLDAVRSDPDQEVRENGVFWLSQVPGDRTVAILDSILRASTDVEIQKKALFALSQNRSDRASETLRTYVGRADAPLELRGNAIFWLGQARGEDNSAYLRDLYTKLTETELREKILFGIAQHRSAENARWLLDRARDSHEDTDLRKRALFWAGQGGAAIADLVAAYDQMPDREMKEQLIFVYSQRSRDPAAVDKLFAIAKNDPDPDLRKKAIFWLGQSRDPRAVQFLSDLISQP